jgi:hypothetical protein
MKPKIFLRIASILLILHDVGHTFGTLGWKKTSDPAKLEVIKQMTDKKFPFMGAVHSFGDAFDGYGFAVILALLLFAAILWISSNVTAQNVVLIKKILGWMSAVLLLWGIDELIFFFPLAATMTLIAMICTVIAIFNLENVPK